MTNLRVRMQALGQNSSDERRCSVVARGRSGDNSPQLEAHRCASQRARERCAAGSARRILRGEGRRAL
eukprot:6180643-Pleurochrysis_carterae.AAC.2